MQNAFRELHEECLTLSRICSKQNKIILSLEIKANDTKVELDKVKNSACNKCQLHESKIVELNQVIKKYEKCKIGLENVLIDKDTQMINVTLVSLNLINKV